MAPQNDQTALVPSIGLRIKSKWVTMVTAAKWPELGSAPPPRSVQVKIFLSLPFCICHVSPCYVMSFLK